MLLRSSFAEIFVKARAAWILDLIGRRDQLQARKEELVAEEPATASIAGKF